jgi:hypothetical protein
MLMTVTNPFTDQPRNVMIGWDENDWSVFSQSTHLIYIGTLEVDSDPEAWGTDGSQLMPLFNVPSPTLPKIMQTKLFGAESSFIVEGSYAIYVTAQNRSTSNSQMTYTTTVDGIGVANPLSMPNWMEDEVVTQGGSVEMVDNPVAFPMKLGQPVTFGTGTDPVVAGVGLGLTMTTTHPDYELINLQFGYRDVVGIA